MITEAIDGLHYRDMANENKKATWQNIFCVRGEVVRVKNLYLQKSSIILGRIA